MEESPAHVKRFTRILKKENRYLTCNKTSSCLEHVTNGDAVFAAVMLRSSVIDPVTEFYANKDFCVVIYETSFSFYIILSRTSIDEI